MSNFRFAKDYLLHRLKANNRHGLHSPFVYRLVDEVIYDFRAKKVYNEVEKLRSNNKTGALPKVDQLLYRLVEDRKPGNLMVLGQVDDATKLYLQKAIAETEINTDLANSGRLDFVLINADEKGQTLKYFEDCLPKVHDNTMLVLNGIYKNDSMKQAWQKIKLNPKVTVTVDLFWMGMVFFRKGQVREDFCIRF
jgi:hypothetical protein